MHGDGRCFIKGKEKDWGLMRLASESRLVIVLDFASSVLTFRLARVIRGKAKETVAEIPGLFPQAALILCMGGRGQKLVLASVERLEMEGEQRKARDVFADAEAAGERVAFSAPQQAATYDEQLKTVATTTE